MEQVLIIGDVILDRYIVGATNRISPEAPVPIVKIEMDYSTLGGAANVANNLSKLEIDTLLYGVCGNDFNKNSLIQLLEENRIKHHLYQEQNIPTTTKTRVVSRNQQMIRLDDEKYFEHTANSIKHFDTELSQKIIIVSDYAKGFCSAEFMSLVIKAKSENAKILVDPKGKDWQKYNGAYLVKPNLSELEEVLNANIQNTDEEVSKYGMQAFRKLDFENLLITRGRKGMTLINNENIKHFPTHNVEVYDVSGAGDTAMAVLAYGLNQEMALNQCIKLANLAASYVVTKPMTYAINLNELKQLL